MAGIRERIRAWAADLKYWERSALEKIANRRDFDEAVYAELVEECIRDAGLAPVPTDRPRLSFPTAEAADLEPEAWRLERLFNLRNVNALPTDQEIPFGPQLTLIFGENGAGKTGYARPLGCAAFARGERDVLPDAADVEGTRIPEAEIEISKGSVKKALKWIKGQRCSELSTFYVFDSTSVSAHLSSANSLGFTPSDLGLLTRLAEETDAVRERFRQRIRSVDPPDTLVSLFEGTSDIATRVSLLCADSDLSDLQKVAGLSREEELEIERIETEIQSIRSQQIEGHIQKRRQEVADLKNLAQSVTYSIRTFDDRTAQECENLVSVLIERRSEAARSGIAQFEFGNFTQIGSDAWLEFIKAAKVLADAESDHASIYPQDGNPCLLCRQPLSNEAANTIRKMWEFLRSTAQARSEAAERACRAKSENIRAVSLEFLGPDSASRRLLESELPTLIPSIESTVESCSARRTALIESLASAAWHSLPPLIEPELSDLLERIRSRDEEIDSLVQSDANARVRELEMRLRLLRHRRTLGEHIRDVEKYVEQKRWVQKANQSLGTTRNITLKYNELFQELVTDRYKELFQSILLRFRLKINVAIDTYAHKGETLRRIGLNSEAYPARYPVEMVLSDGEKMAVALADFLTEASLDETACGIILDDPVTSLGSNWKAVLAERLADYAKERQVIIFTHDLTFLHQISERAGELKVDVLAHWIRDEAGHPGYVYAGNSPLCEGSYKSANVASEYYSKSKNAPPANQQAFLQQGFGALRTSYEALIIFELFKGVVARFEERISFGRLKDVRVEAYAVDQIVERMEALSRHIDAHLHSDNFASKKPTPTDLLDEIQRFEKIRAEVRSGRSASVNAVPAVTPESKAGTRPMSEQAEKTQVN